MHAGVGSCRAADQGQKLRHSYRAVCADLGVDALISHFLLGHAQKEFRKSTFRR
jgi:hypothetical protein